MTKANLKPVKVLLTSEIDNEILEVISEAFKIISREAELDKKIPVEISDFSNYRVPGKRKISKYSTQDQIFEDCIKKQSEKVDLGCLLGIFLNLLMNSHGNDYFDSYYLIATQKYDLKTDNSNFVIGGAWDNIGAVISLLRITGENLPKNNIPKKISFDDFEKEMIITETLHEFGHVFGCAKEGRKYTINKLGSHDDPEFINDCVMLQGMTVPDDWIRMTKKRLKSEHAFCELCREELKDHFST